MESPRTHVLILSPDARVMGGITAFIAMLTAHLTRTRATLMTVGSLQDTSAAAGEYTENAFHVLKRLFTAPIGIAGKVKREHIDVVHLNPSLEGKSLLRDGLILFALRIGGCKRVLVYFHGWRVKLEERLRASFFRRGILVWLLNGVSRIAVLAPEFKQGLESMGVAPGRILVTRTMFDGAALKSAMEAPAPQERRTVLFLSRFARKKGIYELLTAFAHVAAEFPDADLVMAGEGEEGKALQAHAAQYHLGGRITFPGYVTGDAKWRLLLGCTIYALPTYFAEGMPVALLEAMAAGKPLLTSQAGGIRHIASDRQSGVVLGEVTAENVAAGLRLLLANPELCERAGRHNSDVAWEQYEAAKVSGEIETLYHEIAGG